MSWNDFNDAEEQREFDVIPKGTLVKVRMTIKPGGHDDHSQGWSGGYATSNPDTGSVYLSGEFVVLDGQYAKRKVWSLIGLHSKKGPDWGNQGRAFIKSALNSSRGISPTDNSPQAQNARRIQGFADLDGIEFVVKVGIEKSKDQDPKNTISVVIMPGHKDYQTLMSGGAMQQGQAAPVAHQQPETPQNNPPAQQSAQQNNVPSGKPNWAL